jgi:hypothetical protein
LRADASIKRDLHPQGNVISKMSIVSALGKSGRAIGLCAVVACSLRPSLAADDRTFNGFVRSNRLRKMAQCPRIGYRNRARVVPDPAKETSADVGMSKSSLHHHFKAIADRSACSSFAESGTLGGLR